MPCFFMIVENNSVVTSTLTAQVAYNVDVPVTVLDIVAAVAQFRRPKPLQPCPNLSVAEIGKSTYSVQPSRGNAGRND